MKSTQQSQKKLMPKCTFFSAGFCAKGKYCEFSHDDSDPIAACKFFTSSQTCRFGNACAFRHTLPSQTNTGRRQPIVEEHLAIDGNVKEADTVEIQSHHGLQDRENLQLKDAWGFTDGDDDGVYFYGVPGTFPSMEPLKPKYADIVGRQHAQPTIPAAYKKKGPICQFNLLGNCKFGRLCKFSHDADTSGMTHDATTLDTDDKVVECGICMSVPLEFGLLNNCACIFCISCIREWRKEGISVALQGTKVRLCPLCRVESHFVCPSPRLLSGTDKDSFIEIYKSTLAKKRCKFLEDEDGCPFGDSCFYSHEEVGEKEAGGSGASSSALLLRPRGGPRVVSSTGEASSRKHTLAEFISLSLRP